MGWSFAYHDIGRKAHIAELTSQAHFSADYTPLEYRVVGNSVWQLVLHRPSNRKLICLDLIAKDRKGGWGYKGMSEDAGPADVTCPLSLLDKADEPPEFGYAAEWRKKVRAYHAAKVQRKAELAIGTRVKYGGHEYKLRKPAGPRRGWYVDRVSDGCGFRMQAAQLARAEIVADSE